ncbi:hypothetical protein [Pseudomonas putida]|uniref:Uncharacterized protein n=1 Tax=Pseudomonas putida TaxID=303 RepID=A0A1X0ZXS1_PSEPU|nr:hypothetical protein [Pseudomonas putida]ORL64401.1 hypothetical protein B7H17_12450 [Pseudomonas putida]
MQAPNPSSSESKATTTQRRLRAIALVGGALIGFLVTKTPEVRALLENVVKAACEQGDLTAQDADVVHQVLRAHPRPATN